MAKNIIFKILNNGNDSVNNLRIYPSLFGTNKESNLQLLESLGFVVFYQVGFKGNESYILRYNGKELLALGIDIKTDDLTCGLDYLLNKNSEKIIGVAQSLVVSNAEHETILIEKQNNTLSGTLIDFVEDDTIHRTYHAVALSTGDVFVVLDNGFMSPIQKFYNKMKEIYGDNMIYNIRNESYAHLCAISRVR